MVDDDDDGRTDHGHPISSPCEPNGSGELKMWFPNRFDINRAEEAWKMARD